MKSSSLFATVLLFVLVTFTSTKFHKPIYDVLPKPQELGFYNNSDKLTVHMVAHTHDDIGWLKTIDQYYMGDQRDVDISGGVQYILDTVILELQRDPKKKFIYVEIGFFKRWWNEQNPQTKQLVQSLVNNGQLVFINGGYCMNDEAAVYYEDSIDQMTIGHQFLLQNLNVVPTIGWHIDPFGHASAQAALFAQMGFNAFFFGRIDYQDKAARLQNKGMEMVWTPQTSQDVENTIFSVMNYNLYMHPPGFNFDMYSNDKTIGYDPALEGYDMPQRADAFIAYFRQMAQSYRTSTIYHTLGEDFAFQDGHMDFKNYDIFMNYINGQSQYNAEIIYSTPKDYINTINPMGVTYPTKNDDFFPYADSPTSYWTGYFVSRVSIKGAVRKLGQFTQTIKKLAAEVLWQNSSPWVTGNYAQVDQAIGVLEDAMGAGQHHDAVTGTEKQAVAEDYKVYFAKGEDAVKQNFLYPLYSEQVQQRFGLSNLQFSTCNLNTSSVFCGTTWNQLSNGKSVLLVVRNPAQARVSTVRVKVPNGNVQAVNATGTSLVDLDTDVICSNKTDSGDCDLFFRGSFNGYTTYYFYLQPSSESNLVDAQSIQSVQYPITQGQSISIDSSLQNFKLKHCAGAQSQDCYNTGFSLNYNYYKSYQSSSKSEGYRNLGADWQQNSGAYIFKPSNDTISGSIPYARPASGAVYQGKNVLHIHIDSNNILTDIRIYKDLANGIEVSTFVDSINVSDGQGKEIVMLVNVPTINNGNVFYSDSMGMELQKRVLNFRPSWNLTVNEPASGNYVPVQSTILIQDQTDLETFAIIPDRSQGGASLNPGQVEVMIHRRLLQDDSRGVGDALNELDWDGQGMRQWVTHTFLFTKTGYIDTTYRQIQYHNDQPNLVVLAPVSNPQVRATKPDFSEVLRSKFVGDGFDYIKVFARPMGTNKFLLRFQNMDDANEANISTDVFKSDAHGGSGTVTEMSLTANQAKKDMIAQRLNWNGMQLNNPAFAKTDYLTGPTFLLRALEIRTFIVQFNSLTDDVELINI